MKKIVTPYKNSSLSKKEQIVKMFDKISKKYDFLNHFLSLGLDIYWRNQLVYHVKKQQPKNILDVATGTCDLAIALMKAKPNEIIGLDISKKMLEIGSKKLIKKSLRHIIKLQLGDSEKLPFEKDEFDAVTISFGLRNFENIEKSLSEIYRVLKPKGTLYILEFSKPKVFIFKKIYQFYFYHIVPRLGKLFSEDVNAYSYLPESVDNFPYDFKLKKIIKNSRYINVRSYSLSIGVTSIYIAVK